MKKDEHGYIVVETIGAFVPFVLLVISILSLVNIVVVQARVHYAITQTAETISFYSYVLDAAGLSGKLRNLSSQADKGADEVQDFINNCQAIIEGIQSIDPDSVGAGAQGIYDQVEETVDDPKAMLGKLLSLGVGDASDWAFTKLLSPMVGHYLQNGTQSGDEYLKLAQVENGLAGLEFGHTSWISRDGSRLMNDAGDVLITVRYKIDYTFGMLPLPEEMHSTLQVTQHARTKAWLSGNGEGYTG